MSLEGIKAQESCWLIHLGQISSDLVAAVERAIARQRVLDVAVAARHQATRHTALDHKARVGVIRGGGGILVGGQQQLIVSTAAVAPRVSQRPRNATLIVSFTNRN
jgi:hypothetical protein